jgi:hypothetical protein
MPSPYPPDLSDDELLEEARRAHGRTRGHAAAPGEVQGGTGWIPMEDLNVTPASGPAAWRPPDTDPPTAGVVSTDTIFGWIAAAGGDRRIVGAVLLALALFAAFGAAEYFGRDFMSGRAADLRPGDCFDDPTAANESAREVTATVQHHRCSEPHQFEAFASFVYPGGAQAPFPAESEFDAFANEKCDPAFKAYVGSPATSSSLRWYSYVPIEAGWKERDHEVICFLQLSSGAKLTRTMQGSRR